MADVRRARDERRAALTARVAQTAPVDGPPRRSPSPAANAATGSTENEQQASSLHPSVWQDGRTATPSLTPAGSSSHACRAPMDARAALLMAHELLRYRPVDDLYEEWLDRVAELVRAQRANRRRPSLYLTLNQARAMRLMARLHHLCPKMVPWHQGAQPHGVIRHVRCPRAKREAAKKSLGHEELHPRFPRRLVKTVCRPRRRRADLVKTNLQLRSGPQ